jgi:hypothetical protein
MSTARNPPPRHPPGPGDTDNRQLDARALLHREGVDGSSPEEGFAKGQQMAFFVASAAVHPITRSSLNLSPRSVPNISGAGSFGLRKGV